MGASEKPGERGFTLIEVLIATAMFVFVAAAGFEVVRQLGASVLTLAQRASAAADAGTAIAQMRSDSMSATAVWVPHDPACGRPAVSMLRRDAAGLSFTTYLLDGTTLKRVTATGPIDPCNAAGTETLDPVLTNVAGVTVTPIAANALAAQADGALFTAGVPAVSVDSHVRDYDGSTIYSGNSIVEVAVDADPATATVDLVAGNRPGGYTLVLGYTCGPRCAANSTSTNLFPEVRGLNYTQCTVDAPDIPDAPSYYQASATALSATGRIIVTQYQLHLRYSYRFGGGRSAPLTLYRVGPAFTWPGAKNLADPYPVDYTNNAVKATGAAAIVPSAPASGLAANDAVCRAMNDETDFGA